MKVSMPVSSRSNRSSRRLVLLIALGLAAVIISVGVRRSSWAHERRLQVLTTEELALAVHDSPEDALTWKYFGSALLKDNHAPEAENALNRAVKLDPKMAAAYLELGYTQMRQNKGILAKETFKEAVRLAPKDPQSYLALAKAVYAMGSARETIEPLKKIIELDPKNVYAWYTLGKMYGQTHESNLAYDALQRAVQLDPKQALCWRDLAQVSRHYSRFQEAEQQFQKSLALAPNDATTHYWLGQMYLEMGDTETLRAQAQQHLETAVQLTPDLAEGHFELGRVYERRGDWRQAVEHYNRAKTLDPSNSQTLYHLGLCLKKLGKSAEAGSLIKGAQELAAVTHEVEDLENRIRLDPQNRPLRLRLARVFRKYGNDEEALVEYQSYQRLGAQDPSVEREMAEYRTELKRRARQTSSPEASHQ